jgi:prepilin-type N-terminal cleavage/methylation domain-containing protein
MTPHQSRGMTLVEMLVAMTASLILFGAVMTLFQILGDTVGKSRRVGRLEGDLCSVTATIRQDLFGATANKDSKGLACNRSAGGITGYFEVIEGPDSDLIGFPAGSVTPYDKSANAPDSSGRKDWLVGDTDDMLFFTTRSANVDPFIGKYDATTTVANEAEVAYFCRPTAGTSNPTLYTLYRRQLLIVGNLQEPPFNGTPGGRLTANGGTFTPAAWLTDFYSRFDLSARREGNEFILNTANDLQRRRNRFGHDPASSGFPVADPQSIRPLIANHANSVLTLAGVREGEDVLLSNVLSFDVRLVDPEARARQQAGTARLKPGDLNYWSLGPGANLPVGDMVQVDLGYNAGRGAAAAAASPLSDYGLAGHVLTGSATTARVYDTWTAWYRTNNMDDDNSGTADDASEGPPYAAQVPGIQIVIRLYDAESRSIKQTTISQTFKR